MGTKTRELDGKVWCPTCEHYLTPDNYHRNSPERRVRAGSWYRWQCKSCERDASKRRKYKQRYGITLEERDSMINTQEGKCACCRNEFDSTQRGKPVVDHNHDTNEVRDILCERCNLVLGMINEDPMVASNLIDYINRWNH